MPSSITRRGLWFEELQPDVAYRHSPGRTVEEADNTLFSTLTMNPQSLHLDAAASTATEFGERLVNSMSTLSTPGRAQRRAADPGRARRQPLVVLDLEDAVAPERKEQARHLMARAPAELGDRAVVRVNALGTPWHEAEVAAMRAAGAGTGGGVFRHRGQMIDGPLLTRARTIVEKERTWTCN